MHHPADCGFSPFHQQMGVIWHQTVRIEEERQLSLLYCKEAEHPLIIIVIAENELSIVASRDDVVKRTFYFEPGFSSHDLYLPRLKESQYRRPHPGFRGPLCHGIFRYSRIARSQAWHRGRQPHQARGVPRTEDYAQKLRSK